MKARNVIFRSIAVICIGVAFSGCMSRKVNLLDKDTSSMPIASGKYALTVDGAIVNGKWEKSDDEALVTIEQNPASMSYEIRIDGTGDDGSEKVEEYGARFHGLGDAYYVLELEPKAESWCTKTCLFVAQIKNEEIVVSVGLPEAVSKMLGEQFGIQDLASENFWWQSNSSDLDLAIIREAVGRYSGQIDAKARLRLIRRVNKL